VLIDKARETKESSNKVQHYVSTTVIFVLQVIFVLIFVLEHEHIAAYNNALYIMHKYDIYTSDIIITSTQIFPITTVYRLPSL